MDTSFCCRSNFITLIVTRSLRMRGQRAFRSSSVYAAAIIGPCSRVYGSFSCSCKRANVAFAFFLITNTDLTISLSLSLQSFDCNSSGVTRSHFAIAREKNVKTGCHIRDSFHFLCYCHRNLNAVLRASCCLEIYGPKACDPTRQTMGG